MFNRLETTKRVFAEIAKQKPNCLFLIADGPRNKIEAEKCLAVRQHVLQSIDWICEVHTNFSEVNLGCRTRMSSGITWVFQHTNEAIILEDDCLPDPTFFPYCQELLTRYREEERVMMISGNNGLFGRKYTNDSYYISHYPRIWGWATWKRAWDLYDVSVKDWPQNRQIIFNKNDVDPVFWSRCFNQVFQGFDTWDYQWVYAMWKNQGRSITPSVNLIKNIGFGPDATHCFYANDKFANQPTCPMIFPLQHPTDLSPNKQADDFERASHFRV